MKFEKKNVQGKKAVKRNQINENREIITLSVNDLLHQLQGRDWQSR